MASFLLGRDDIPLPLRVTAAKRGVGSFLTIDLAGAGADVWLLWVHLCDWDIEIDGERVLDSECTANEQYERALTQLIGCELERSTVEDDLEACTLFFSGGIELFFSDANDLYGDGQDLMMIFRNGKFVVAFRGGIGIDASQDRAQ